MDWMILPLKRYADFEGRSRRTEYWMFVLFQLIVYVVLTGIMFAGLPWDDLDNPNSEPGPLFILGLVLIGLFWLGTIIPSIAVHVRRFHDQDKSGWLYLLVLIPYLGGLIIFIFMCLDGTSGPNRFGNDPKDPHNAGVFV